MLWRILDAYGGSLPKESFVLFANTGKERDETLNFVYDVEINFRVKIYWLEYVEKGNIRGRVIYKVVDHETAHRTNAPNSPFEKLIGEMRVLPNPRARNCTKQLKIMTMRSFLADIGWNEDFHRFSAIGIRADESHRVIQIAADCPKFITPVFPLVDSGVTEKDVLGFWKAQTFDLGLMSHEGNCDLCFLKAKHKLINIIKKRPQLADWWIAMEKVKSPQGGNGNRFRDDRTYEGLYYQANVRMLFDDIEDDISCGCISGVGDWSDT